MWTLFFIAVCWYAIIAQAAKKNPEKTREVGKTIASCAGKAAKAWLESKARRR